MKNFFNDNDDLQYYFDEGIDWEPLVRATEFDWRAKDGPKGAREAVEVYRDIAAMVGELSAREIAPHAAEIDREGVKLVDGEAVMPARMQAIFDQLASLELHGLCLPRELGGMNCPLLLYFINSEIMGRADVSVMAHASFHGGMAMAMLVYSIREGSTRIDPETSKIVETRWRREIEEIRTGAAWGCMDITEPHAGSDMAALRTVGEQDADGNWFVTGEKIFITSGHGKYHFVIARTEQPEADGRAQDDPFAGLGGLSMFLVPAYEDLPDGTRRRIVQLSRLEEKLGHHGSATAALVFDRAPAQLVGERGQGFRHMLTLMNNARLGVGFESIGLCEAAWRAAQRYAEERPSMGKTIDRHEMIADYLEEMRTDTQGLRALAMWAAWREELGRKLEMGERLGIRTEEDLGRESKRLQREARRATPLLKYLAAEKAVELGRRCVQIHGGNGYMKEYGAEKLLRDAMVMPIYEGTSQIQALMAMKDTLGGVMKNPPAFLRRMAQARWRSVSARDPLERRVAKLSVLSMGAQQFLLTRTAGSKLRSLTEVPIGAWAERVGNWDPKKDFALAMLHAERLTRILADEMVCEVLLEQATKHPHRRELLERYLERAEPRCRHLDDEIRTTGARLLHRLGEAADPDRPAARDAAE